MKKALTFILLSCWSFLSYSQHISERDEAELSRKEDSMKAYSIKIIQGINSKDRFGADSIFTRILVRALRTRNSFYYPFDSLETISKLYAPDSSFRIYTWQMVINDLVTRQHGAIQMRTEDGSLKLFPLIDKSDITKNIADTIGNNMGWIGAVYYRIIQKQYRDKNYYTLLGYDEHTISSNRKIIEVLSFNNGEPVFGGRYFSFEKDTVARGGVNRYVMEYKKEAGARLTYDPDMDMIVFEHLISETNEPNKKWTLVGDGDYEGFTWVNGKWVHVEKIFHYVTPEGKEPVPKPMRDAQGNILDEPPKPFDNTGEDKPEPVKTKTKTTIRKNKVKTKGG